MGIKLFVFDLDFTIWDAGGTWCDCTYPPYSMHGDNVQDIDGRLIKMYPEVKEILRYLSSNNKLVSVASRTSAPGIANELMVLFGIHSYFIHPQIYPGSKVMHFKQIHKNLSVPYSEMVFFDDEYRNIKEVSELGVSCEYLEFGGLNWDIVRPYV